jgi:hypothetical protein
MSVPPNKKHKAYQPEAGAPMTSAQLLECKALLDQVLAEKDQKSVELLFRPRSVVHASHPLM